ncbi:hypothetical protein M0R45_017438 [Rubus argutus]|uniref:Uncharacterized protein n=1 Tax=Rubus argutus TaxID=59490 RepID=A0AAW1XVJ0_RUBAR
MGDLGFVIAEELHRSLTVDTESRGEELELVLTVLLWVRLSELAEGKARVCRKGGEAVIDDLGSGIVLIAVVAIMDVMDGLRGELMCCLSRR